MPFSGYIVDRNFTFQGASQSPISYKVEGTTGNRILKLEVKNAGSGYEAENNQPSTLFVNYQVWLYEADKSIEYHYGNHNFTNLNMLNDDGVSAVYFAIEDDNDFNGLYLEGTIQNPTSTETQDPDDEPANLGAVPTPNTVYRFEVDPLAIKDQTKVSFNVYPNPTTDILNITVEENNNYEYVVYDAVGRFVSSGKLLSDNNVVNVSHLNNGIYYFKVGATVKNFIKK